MTPASGNSPGGGGSSTSSAAAKNRNVFLSLQSRFLKKENVVVEKKNYDISGVRFCAMGDDEIRKYSQLRLYNGELYTSAAANAAGRGEGKATQGPTLPVKFGVLDPHLGISRRDGTCLTCGRNLESCAGHWGHLPLEHPVFHVGFFKHIIVVLYCICKRCGKLLMTEENKKVYLARMRRLKDDTIMKRALLRRVVELCKKQHVCLDPSCGALQGVLRRIQKPSIDQFMKIVHQTRAKEKGRVNAVHNENLDPRYVARLFSIMSPTDCEVLDIATPANLIIQTVLIAPNCIRPTVVLGDSGTNEDDLTMSFKEIVKINNAIKYMTQTGAPCNQILSNWEVLQVQCARFINAETPGLQQIMTQLGDTRKHSRGICQRLKGKDGRFRCNLSGKRVDFSGRTVISPDPNCPVSDVCIPEWSAKRLTFPDVTCEANIERLRKSIVQGPDSWPGAAYVCKVLGCPMLPSKSYTLSLAEAASPFATVIVVRWPNLCK